MLDDYTCPCAQPSKESVLKDQALMEKYHQTLKVRVDENADAKKIPEPEADQLREELQDLLKTTISALNNIGD